MDFTLERDNSFLDMLDEQSNGQWVDDNIFCDSNHILAEMPNFLTFPDFNNNMMGTSSGFTLSSQITSTEPILTKHSIKLQQSTSDDYDDSSSEYDESESDDDGDSDSSNQETPIASTPERSPSRSASPLTIQSIQVAQVQRLPISFSEIQTIKPEDEDYTSDFEPLQKKRKRSVSKNKLKKELVAYAGQGKLPQCPFKTCQLCSDRSSMQLETLKNQRWRGTAMALLYYYPDKDEDGYVQVNSPDVILYLQAHWNELAPYHQRDVAFDPEKVKKHVLDALSHNQDCFVNRRFDQGKKSRGYWKVREEAPVDFAAELANQSLRLKGRKNKNKKLKTKAVL